MPHLEGTFDSKSDALRKIKELRSQGYASRMFVTKYGPHTPPLYRVFRADNQHEPYPKSKATGYK